MQLNYWCYINHTGYSISAQDYIFAMKQRDPDFKIKVLPLNKQLDLGVSKNRSQLFRAMEKEKILEGNCVNVYHSIPHRYRRHKGPKKHIGICLFETVNLPGEWVGMMNEMDSIITASSFNENVFRTHGVNVPIHKIPHCFDPKMFNKEVSDHGRYGTFTFLSIGTWKQRKNWEGLIKAFYDAFEDKDGVCLLIKTDKPQELKSTVERIKRTCEWRSKSTAPIFAEPKAYCNFEDIPSFMQKGDVYVSASLGEGFGLPGLHAMALGIPVLTTRFGGALEYAKPEFATYIEPKNYRKHSSLDNLPQFRNTIWPVIRIGEIRDKLKYMKENFHIVKKKSEDAYEYVHKNFTYDVIGENFIQVINA